MPKGNYEAYSRGSRSNVHREGDNGGLPSIEHQGGKNSEGMTGTKYTGKHTHGQSGGFSKVRGQKKKGPMGGGGGSYGKMDY